ncbi:FecR domain-containing protein [Wolinella succinogenes]|uniref:FecR protein domain-containing protein n=1 Tax=Wolinella succinogenes (strain ATCC 29543 / DSM 1740 / CCUG 13145 / JCM 31913 / LMG 7466 / NCTC 11488 / FDC 602W) TaxID=273121 RepID=Q7MR64_WOLSU|nr:FecR family protein [Wolinella succinogenes]CAE10662.1 hypothetical protein WS1631 [Wolinella succinogenes]VEG80809.1 FecR protein [Wolinella succinogenes]HCZ18663.1 hypothetical protein [Helicobacter sp.]
MKFYRIGACLLFFCATWLNAGVGKISLLQGEATLTRGNDSLRAQNAMPLEEGDLIKTGAGSRLQLLFDDKTVVTLGEATLFSVTEYLKEGSDPKAKFNVAQGAFKVITGQIGKVAPQNFQIQTKTATIGIRGTIIWGVIGEDGDQIGCLDGSIEVGSLGGGESVLLRPNQMSFVPPMGPPTPPAPLNPSLFSPEANSGGAPMTPAPPLTSENQGEGMGLGIQELANQLITQANNQRQLQQIEENLSPVMGLTPASYIENLIVQNISLEYQGNIHGTVTDMSSNTYNILQNEDNRFTLGINFGSNSSFDVFMNFEIGTPMAPTYLSELGFDGDLIVNPSTSSFAGEQNSGMGVSGGSISGVFNGSGANSVTGAINGELSPPSSPSYILNGTFSAIKQ